MMRYATYEILGSTSKISAAQMLDIIKWRKYIVQFAKNHSEEVFINGPAAEKKISLTFDDGPDSSVTPAVLGILNKNNIKGSFFFVGTQINYFPGVVKTAYADGHLILNHSWDHPFFTKINSQSIKDEVIRTENRIQAIIGRKPALLRPPYGDLDEKALAAVNTTNNKAVIWSIDSMDWLNGIDRKNIVDNVVNNARPGDIVLMHSGVGQRAVLDVLQIIINELNKKKFKIVDLGELLNINPYK
ncbi:MAG: polysaccharide deacetylase family protein [Bacillota bacterium]|nr:polysaccharide deacetylase family protein [Bacillota bacterium]